MLALPIRHQLSVTQIVSSKQEARNVCPDDSRDGFTFHIIIHSFDVPPLHGWTRSKA